MAKTRAEIEGWKPKDRESEDIIIPEIIDDPVENIKNLKPIDNLDFEKFAKNLATNMNNPEGYSSILKGFFKRWKLNSGIKSVQLMEEYLQKLRTASDSAAELQTALIKNRIIFMYQVQFAEKRLKHQWGVEAIGYEYEIESKKADIAEKRFWARFYDNTKPDQLSETALLLLSMVRPTAVTTTSTDVNLLGAKSSGSSVSYGSIEGVLQARNNQPMMDLVMKKLLADLEITNGTAKKTNAEGRRTEIQADLEEWDAKEQMKKK